MLLVTYSVVFLFLPQAEHIIQEALSPFSWGRSDRFNKGSLSFTVYSGSPKNCSGRVAWLIKPQKPITSPSTNSCYCLSALLFLGISFIYYLWTVRRPSVWYFKLFFHFHEVALLLHSAQPPSSSLFIAKIEAVRWLLSYSWLVCQNEVIIMLLNLVVFYHQSN